MFRPAFSSARESRSGRQHSFRPQLEHLEDRTLLDANPQVQLSADLGKLGFDMTRASIDAAVFADEVAVASGVGTPEAVASLAALAPAMKYAGMVSDIASLVKDFRGRNIAGMMGDLLSLSEDTVFAIGGDIIAIRQDSMAIINDLAHVLTGTPIPQSSPAPTPTPVPASVGTYSANLVPSSTDGNVSPDAPQKLTLTLKADGSGSLSISPFAGTPLTVNFPAGTAQLGNDGSVSLNYGPASGVQISVANAELTNNGNALQGTFSIDSGDSNFDSANFDNATLNRQG